MPPFFPLLEVKLLVINIKILLYNMLTSRETNLLVASELDERYRIKKEIYYTDIARDVKIYMMNKLIDIHVDIVIKASRGKEIL